MLNQAKRHLIIKENYATADYVKYGKQSKRKIESMDKAEVEKFLNYLNNQDNVQMGIALKVLLFIGIRRGELCGLEWNDINLNNGYVYIRRSVSSVSGLGVVEIDTKRESSQRLLTMPNVLINTLAKNKEWQAEQRKQLGDMWQGCRGSGKVFTGQLGDRLHPSMITNWMNRATKGAKMQHYSVHSLRHTNITLQIEEGVPIAAISARAGHAKISTTLDIYSHFLREADKKAINTLDNISKNRKILFKYIKKVYF